MKQSLLEWMSAELKLSETFISQVSESAAYRYRRYHIPKRAGGTRVIYHPSSELKALQRWLARRIIPKLPVHPAAAAYIQGRSIRDNAEKHANARYMLRIDLQQFFGSITSFDIEKHLKKHIRLLDNWKKEDTDLFTKICCRHFRLVIGAPSSPSLSNTVCYKLDKELSDISLQHGVTYSRYADDLVFSTTSRGMLKEVERKVSNAIQSVTYPMNLKINHKKTRHTSRRHRQAVTGLIVTPDSRISVGRRLKRRVRFEVFSLNELDHKTRLHLSGNLAFIKSIEPQFLDSLIIKYGRDVVHAAMYPNGSVPCLPKREEMVFVMEDTTTKSVLLVWNKPDARWQLPRFVLSGTKQNQVSTEPIMDSTGSASSLAKRIIRSSYSYQPPHLLRTTYYKADVKPLRMENTRWLNLQGSIFSEKLLKSDAEFITKNIQPASAKTLAKLSK